MTLSRRIALCAATIMLVVTGLSVINATPAGADANVGLSTTTPATVLYGTPSTVTLRASNTSAAVEYNASFSAVLPLGVSYVKGSTTESSAGVTAPGPDPTSYPGVPGAGQTTLVWPNVGDLQVASSQGLAFSVQGQTDAGALMGPNPILPGGTYTVDASVYTNADPHYVPTWSNAGTINPTSYTNSDASSTTTTVVPITTKISDPWSQGEALRGAHQNQFVYTITTTNNAVQNTNNIDVTDWIPAGVEFMGCGGVDNTTDAAGTNPGYVDEYPGSGGLSVGAPLSPAVCPTPTSVTTVTNPVQPNGNVLSGVYTVVTWAAGSLTPTPGSNVSTIQFVAAIPLRENSMTWSGPTPPTTGAQGSNLDNNQGPETVDGQALTSSVGAIGDYAGPLHPGTLNPVDSYASDTITAVDLKVVKSISPTTFTAGNIATVSLHYQTSEYRYTTTPILSDVLPSGLCPLGPVNYTTDASSAECAPQPGVLPSTPYSSVTENNDGSFNIAWSVATLPPNADHTITFPALMRTNYIASLSPSTPVVAGDGLADHANIAGTTHATCFTGTQPNTTPDPTCSAPGATPIYSGETTPGNPSRGSTASQGTAAPTLIKRIASPPTSNCATANYVTSTDPSYPPVYQTGDTVCFQIEMDFPQGTMTRSPVITDFLPDGATYVTSTPTPANTVTIPPGQPTDAATVPDSVTWAVGDSIYGGRYAGPGQVFEVNVQATITASPTLGNNFTLTGNLAKASALNTAGAGISLRSQASYNLSRPVLSLVKTVSAINGVPVVGPTPSVSAGDTVTYDVTISNTGLAGATNMPVWDNLPGVVTGTAPYDCATLVSSISNAGTCATGTQVQWTNLSVPAGTLDPITNIITPGTTTLDYTMTVPNTVAPGEVLVNHAGVVSYQGTTLDDGNPTQTYYPPNNIDPLAPADPSTLTPADDTASVTAIGVSMDKTRTTSVTEAGNNTSSQATIGESITYTVTATIPANTKVFAGSLADPLGTLNTGPQNLVVGSTTATVNGGALPGGWSISETANTPTVVLPATYGPVGTDTTVSMTFTALVNDVAANVRGASITNTGHFDYQSSTGAPLSTDSPQVATTVVEPSISMTKSDLPGSPYAPGDTVNYTLTITNSSAANVSTAHDVTATDTLPVGLTPVVGSISNGGVATLSGGIWSIAWNLGPTSTIAPGAAQTLTYSATLPATPVGHAAYTNNATSAVTSLDTATYPGARTNGTGYSATAQDTISVLGVTVAKVATPTTVTNGVDTTYTATFSVPANTAFPQATAIDTLPDGMRFGSYGAFTCANADLTACGPDVAISGIGTPTPNLTNGTTALAWWLGNLTPDSQVRTITLSYTAHPAKNYITSPGPKVNPGAVLTNSVAGYWQPTTGTAPITIPSTGSYTYSSPLATAPITVIGPSLTLTKTTSTASPIPGVPFTYTIKVANSNAATSSCAYSPAVTDPLPTGLSGVTNITTSQGSASYSGGVLTWDPSTTAASCTDGPGLAKGVTATLTFDTVLAASNTLTTGQVIPNVATITSYFGVDAATATSQPSRYVAYGPVNKTVNVTPIFPTPHATKSTPSGSAAFIGSPFTWAFTLTNTTNSPALNTTATDILPAYWTYNPGSTTITLAGGGTVTGAAADPSVSVTGNVATLTWSSTQLAGIANTSQSITVSYTATPATGAATGPINPNTNAVSATVQDNSGAPGNATGAYQSNNATADAFIASADLKIIKTVGTPGGFIAGGSNNYFNLDVSNLGPSSATTPVVTDTTPPGATWTFASASGTGWNCVTAPTTLTCTATSNLASNTSAATIRVDVNVPSDFGPNDITNTAHVTSTTYDPDGSNNTSTVTTTVATSADLGITKTHLGTFTAGGSGTYQVTVTNHGPSDSPPVGPGNPTPITVTDTLPTGLTYNSLQPGSGWSCTPTTPVVIVCTYAAGLVNGASTTFNLDVNIDSGVATGTTLTNHADITATTVTDPNPNNNHATDQVTIGTSADISIAKTHAGTDTFTPGTDVHYNLAVANAGPSDALNPVVTDNLDPAVFDSASASGTGWNCTVVTLTVTCTATSPLVALTSAQPITVVAHIKSSFTGTVVTNTANVLSPTPDPNLNNNTSTDTSATGDTSADLAVTKTHSPTDFTAGATGTYTITATNNGPSDALNPSVVDTLPVGMSYVASTTPAGWTATPGPLTPGVGQVITFSTAPAFTLTNGGTATFTLTIMVDSAVPNVSLDNSVTVSSPTPDPNPGNNTWVDPTQIITSADLAIIKTHDVASTFTPGTSATYHFAITNYGPSDAVAPVIADTLPLGLTYVSGSVSVTGVGPSWTCATSGQTVTCTAGANMANGNAQVVSIDVLVDSAYTGAAFTNTATIHSTTTDPVLSNNTSTDTSPLPVPSADLAIAKTALGTFTAGSPASYTLSVANFGPSDANNPVVQDTLPAGLTYVSASAPGWTCNASPAVTLTCTYNTTLAAGATAPLITLNVTIASSAVGTISNTATVTSTTSDPNPANNTSTVITPLDTSADLSIVKSHTGHLVIGSTVSYTLAVANAGPSDALNAVVSDTLPTGLTYVSASGTGWTCIAAPAVTATCTANAPIAANTSAAPITLLATVDAAAFPTVINTATVGSTTPDPNPTNNTSHDPGIVDPLADLSITKTAAGSVIAGNKLTYTLATANLGPTLDPGPITVLDTLPTGLTYDSATGIGWTCSAIGQAVTCTTPGPFAVGAGQPITLVTTVGAAAVPRVINTATVSGHAVDPNPANNTSTVSTTVTDGSVLTIAKTLLTERLVSGERATYSIAVTNHGPSDATDVVVTDPLPVGLSYVSATGPGWTCSNAGQVVTCNLAGSLVVGTTATITLVVDVTATDGTIANTATVASSTSILATSTTTDTTPPAPVSPPAPKPNPSPTPGQLAWTGMDLRTLIIAGVGLVLLGAVLMLTGKARRKPKTDQPES